jgi:DNA-binding protein YbaB
MVKWLSKKTSPALAEIEADKVSELAENGKVNVVLYGKEQVKAVEEVANADDYNSTTCSIQTTT